MRSIPKYKKKCEVYRNIKVKDKYTKINLPLIGYFMWCSGEDEINVLIVQNAIEQSHYD
jgi:hypothetical protein